MAGKTVSRRPGVGTNQRRLGTGVVMSVERVALRQRPIKLLYAGVSDFGTVEP